MCLCHHARKPGTPSPTERDLSATQNLSVPRLAQSCPPAGQKNIMHDELMHVGRRPPPHWEPPSPSLCCPGPPGAGQLPSQSTDQTCSSTTGHPSSSQSAHMFYLEQACPLPHQACGDADGSSHGHQWQNGHLTRTPAHTNAEHPLEVRNLSGTSAFGGTAQLRYCQTQPRCSLQGPSAILRLPVACSSTTQRSGNHFQLLTPSADRQFCSPLPTVCFHSSPLTVPARTSAHC